LGKISRLVYTQILERENNKFSSDPQFQEFLILNRKLLYKTGSLNFICSAYVDACR